MWPRQSERHTITINRDVVSSKTKIKEKNKTMWNNIQCVKHTRCYEVGQYWSESRLWYSTILGCKPPLRTIGPKIFGFEAEPWNSLENIFYRSVRYAVFKARHSRTPPDLTTLRGLVFDELERKYSHNKHLRYEESEQVAISWYLRQRKERPLEPLFGKWSDPNMYHLLHFVVK